MVSDFDYKARRIAKEFNSDIEIVSIEKDDHLFLSEVDLLVKMTEEPIADFTGVSSYKISRKAQQLGFKVMLSGMGLMNCTPDIHVISFSCMHDTLEYYFTY